MLSKYNANAQKEYKGGRKGAGTGAAISYYQNKIASFSPPTSASTNYSTNTATGKNTNKKKDEKDRLMH